MDHPTKLLMKVVQDVRMAALAFALALGAVFVVPGSALAAGCAPGSVPASGCDCFDVKGGHACGCCVAGRR